MNARLVITTVVVALLSSGCATTDIGHSELSQPATKDEFRVGSVLRYTKTGNALQANAEHGILPGVYKADQVSAAGTFYRCEGRCIWARMVGDEKTYLYLGGIFVPRDSSSPPTIYRILSSVQSTNSLDNYMNQLGTANATAGGPVNANIVGGAIAGAIVQAAIAAEEGKHTLLPPSEDQGFLQKLKAIIATRSVPQR